MLTIRFAILAALVLPSLALAQAGRVLLAVGDVVAVRAGQELRLGVGAPIQSGDTIRLGPSSNAQIRMSDESIISLRERTVFRIDEYVYSGRVDGSEKSLFSLLAGGMRTVTGVIGNLRRTEKYAVRTATSTIGIRGTHYTLRECQDDCFEAGGGATASAPIHFASAAQSDAGPLAQLKPPLGKLAPNGTYGGVTDGRIGVTNKAADVEFGANQFFFVADQNTAPARLLAPPGFLHDRLEGQVRAKGQNGKETGETLGEGGINAESRPSDVPAGPKPSDFVVTEQKTATGESTVIGTATTHGILGGWVSADGKGGAGGALVTTSMFTLDANGALASFNVPNGTPGPNDGDGASGKFSNILQSGCGSSLPICWGHWLNGTVTENVGTVTNPAGGFHGLVGPLTPPEAIASKSGSFLFNPMAGTIPTNNLGQLATTALFPAIDVNFIAKTANISWAGGPHWIFTSQSWTMPGGTAKIVFVPGKGAYFDPLLTGGSCSGSGCRGSISLDAAGIFMGPTGNHLGVAFGAQSGTASAHAVRVYFCPSC